MQNRKGSVRKYSLRLMLSRGDGGVKQIKHHDWTQNNATNDAK